MAKTRLGLADIRFLLLVAATITLSILLTPAEQILNRWQKRHWQKRP